MATIEELSSALIKADAAGNAADAKVFADEIRRLQAAPAVKSEIPSARKELESEIRPTPQNPVLGAVASVLKAREEAEKGMGPSIMRTILSGILPSAATVEKWSYGDPLMRMPPAGTGGYVPVMTSDKPYLAETVGMGINALPAVRPAVNALGREAMLAGEFLRNAPADVGSAVGAARLGGLRNTLTLATPAELAAQRRAEQSAKAWQQAGRIEGAQAAQRLGIAINPAESNPTLANRLKGGIVANRDLDAKLSRANEAKWTDLAKQDTGIPQDVKLSEKVYSDRLDELSEPYARVSKVDMPPHALAWINDIRVSPKGIGEAASSQIDSLVDEVKKHLEEGMSGKDLVTRIRTLRQHADALYSAQKQGVAPEPGRMAVADANKKLSEFLEYQIESNLSGKDLADLKAARAEMAKVHAYQDATDFNTGLIDPNKIAKITSKGGPYTGILKDIGEVAGNFPGAAQMGEQRGATFGRLRLTRSGVPGTIGLAVGGLPGAVTGAAIGEVGSAALARRMLSPSYQAAHAAPKDLRIFPEVPKPAPAVPTLESLGPTELQFSGYTPNWVFGGEQPTPQFNPAAARNLLAAPSPEGTINALRAEDARRAAVSRAMGQEAEAAQAAAEAAAPRAPTRGGVELQFNPHTGRLEEVTAAAARLPEMSSLESAVQKLSGQMVGGTETQFSRISTGKPGAQGEPKFYVRGKTTEIPATREPQAFALTATEKIAWDRAKANLAEIAPGFKALTDKAIAEKMMDRDWVEQAIQKARDQAKAFDEIATRAKNAQARAKAQADRERMMDVADELEDTLRVVKRPKVGQGPQTRAAQRNQLAGEAENKNFLAR